MRLSREVSKVAALAVGYDVFISYRHADAQEYAKTLERVLEARGLMVFRDETEEDAGVPLETFIERACSARTFIVLATPTVFQSSSVLAELSSYLKRRIDRWYRRPFSRVISINVAQTLSKAPSEPAEWRRLSDFVYEPEALEAFANAAPSEAVVERLFRASSFMRSWRRFILIVGVAVVGILLSIAGTSLHLKSVVQDLSHNRAALLDAKREAAKLVSSNELLSKQNESLVTSAKSLRAEGLNLRASNSTLESQNNDLARQAQQLAKNNSFLTGRNNDLSLQSSMLQIRIAAQNQVAEDPLFAYRLAAEAYRLVPDQANRKLILSSLSRIDLFYSSLIKGYTIEDFKEPFILLSKEGKGRESKDFLIFNMNTLNTQPANVKAHRAWVVPIGKAWNLLTLNWVGTGLDSIANYQLYDRGGQPLSEAIQAGKISQIKFLNNTQISLPLYGDARMLIWDLTNNSREFVKQDTSKGFDTYFYDIYGALDSRGDGVSAAHFRDGLVLIGKDGKIDMESYTKADFDPSVFFSAARWSPDGQYLALNYFDSHRLGIWNPAKRAFVWLDPDKWVVDSYSWSLNGHQLAFSGRTENDIDVTVEVVDAASPEQTRRVVYRGEVPVKSMVFLPGNESLAISDRASHISVIQISTGKVTENGYQKGVDKLFSTPGAFYSSSPNEFRVWSAKPAPSRHWTFLSSRGRVYRPNGAADPSWNWLAVAYIDNGKTGGIELRKIRSGEKLELSVPDLFSISLRFSEDGKWLMLETLNTLRIYDTESWRYRDFTLQQDDKQFISLRAVGGTAYAHVLGKDWMSNTSNEYDYVVKFNEGQPVLADRIYFKEERKDESNQDLLLKEIDGWEVGTLYKYQSAGILSSPNSGWAYYARCRDQALGASDCDVQFLPTDLDKIMRLYDPLLWKPTSEELKVWLQ